MPKIFTAPTKALHSSNLSVYETFLAWRLIAMLVGLLVASGGTAHAVIIGTSGSATEIDAPASVAQGALESNAGFFVFEERLSIELISDLAVDTTAPGSYDAESDLDFGMILAGTLVDSHLIHFDPEGGSGSTLFTAGSVTFANPIVGVIVLTASLDGSDALLGSLSTAYGPFVRRNFRGVELSGNPLLNGDPDMFAISADRRTFSMDHVAVSQIAVDQFRVLTAVPEPGAASLISLGLMALSASRGRSCRHDVPRR